MMLTKLTMMMKMTALKIVQNNLLAIRKETVERALELNITKAKPEDRQAVLKLSQNFSEDYLEYTVDKWTRQERGGLHLAWHGNLLVGCCSLDFPTSKEAWLQGMRVHPAYQGKGIAFQLNRFLIELARTKGAEVARLLTAQNNSQALKVAYKLGFTAYEKSRVIIFRETLKQLSDHKTANSNAIKLCSTSEKDQALSLVQNGPFSRDLKGFFFGPQYNFRRLSKPYLEQAVSENRIYLFENDNQLRGLVVTIPEQEEKHLIVSYLDAPETDLSTLKDLFRTWAESGFTHFTISLLEEQHLILQPALKELFGNYECEQWLLMENSLV